MAERFPQQATTVIIPAEPECIQTERLILRPMQPADALGIFAIRSHPEVVKFFWPRTPDQDMQQTEKWMAGKKFTTPDGLGALHRRFQFVIIRTDDPTQRIIGTVGINGLTPAPSIGYGIHPKFWGMGYSTEAAHGVVQAWWRLPRAKADRQLPNEWQQERLYACCNKDNIGSCKVLEKIGFCVYNEELLEGDQVLFWHLERV